MAVPQNLRGASPKTGGLNKWLIGGGLGGGVLLAVYVFGTSDAPPIMPEATEHEEPIASGGNSISEGLPSEYAFTPAVVDEPKEPESAPLAELAPEPIPRPPSAPLARCVRPPTTYAPGELRQASIDAAEYRDCLAERAYARAMEDYNWEHGGGAMGQGQQRNGGTQRSNTQRSAPAASSPSSAPAQASGGADVQKASFDPSDRQGSFRAAVANDTALYHNQAPEDLPEDACVVAAGTLIPATFLHGVNPNMAGSVTAVTSRDVYDWTRRDVAIPAWTKIETTYDYEITYGQESLQVVSTILTTPDGRTMSMGGMTAGDASGMAGIPIDVNNHNARVFGAAVAGALIDAIPAFAGLRTNVNFSSGADEIASTGRMLVEREIERSPTARPVEAGTEITIKVPQHVIMCPEAL